MGENIKILITGATGFVGRRLSDLAIEHGWCIRKVVRSSSYNDDFAVGEINEKTDWIKALDKIDVVVHLAARAHILKETTTNPLENYRRINVEGTLNLARQAAANGIKRFVFISSIGVNGNCNTRPFTEDDPPNPVEPYAISKYEAEKYLQKLANESGMELVIIRPPLVYGPNVPGNFRRLIRLVDRRIPLPLGAIKNKRTFVALDNLVDLIMCCVTNSKAANQIFLAGDDRDISIKELLLILGEALGKPPILLPVPEVLLNIVSVMVGKQHEMRRLCDSLQVDVSKARKLLGWTPPVDTEVALQKTAEHYMQFER